MGTTLEVGSFIQFDSESGSTGIVTHIERSSRDPRVYVRYYFGLNVKGEPMTDTAGSPASVYREITAAEFNRRAHSKGERFASPKVLQGLIHLAKARGGDTVDDKIPVLCDEPHHQARSIHRADVTCLACKARYEVMFGEQKKEEPKTTQPCPACKFENEWGSEEVPHPIDPRVHECVIQKGQEAVDDALAKYREALIPGYKRMPTVVGRLSFSREPEQPRIYATVNIGDERLEWQVACTKALMESQERLAAEVTANIERANFNERRWQECAADYAQERARRQELEQKVDVEPIITSAEMNHLRTDRDRLAKMVDEADRQILKLTAERDHLLAEVKRLSPPPTPVTDALADRVRAKNLKEAKERLEKLEHEFYLCSLGDRPQSPGVAAFREAEALREFIREAEKAKQGR